MRENLQKALDFILRWEGWRSDDKDDAGGRTVWGICERDNPEDVSRMWDMSKEDAKVEARRLYSEREWVRCACDNLPWPMDIVVMDTAVNNGVGIALKFLSVAPRDPVKFLALRDARYEAIARKGNNGKFLRGWLNRTAELRKVAGLT